jgi:putative membrane protein
MSDMQKVLESLETVAARCLEKASLLERLPFDVGAATVTPEEFMVADGMGPGGITTVVVKAGEQKTAYVVIDGNNMSSGLRERILEALRSAGFDGEVFTTDTHVVNAVVLSDRGYHPVGEAMDNGKLIGYIKETALAALAKLKRVENVCCCKVTIPKAKVIGAKQLETLCLVTDKAIQKAKRISGPIFALSGLALMLFLMLI